MTHKLATGENFDIVRGNQTVRVPFDATDPASNPSQNEMAEAVKKIFAALGGTMQ